MTAACEDGATPYCVWVAFGFALVVLSVPLYVAILVLFYKRRNHEILGAPFFKLMFNLGVADLLNVLASYASYQSVYVFGWLSGLYVWGQGTLLRMVIIAVFMSSHAQQVGCLLILINRVIAFVKPFTHTTYWYSRNLGLALAAPWVIGALAILPLLRPGRPMFEVHQPSPNSSQIFLWWTNSDELIYYMISTGIFSSIVALTLGIGYSFLFGLFAAKAKNINQSYSNAEKQAAFMRRSSIRMAVIGLLVSSVWLATGLVFIASRVCALLNIDVAFYQYVSLNIINNLNGAMNPWLLLAFSKPTREEFCKMIGIARNTVVPAAN